MSPAAPTPAPTSASTPAPASARRPSRPAPVPSPAPAPRRAARSGRRAARWSATLALAGLVTGGLAVAPGAASAACPRTGCPGEGWEEPAEPQPVVLAVTGMNPGYGWSGDTVTVTGTGLTGAAVTVAGAPAAVTSRSATSLRFVVPPLPVGPAGPASHPVVVSGPAGTATREFTVSAALQATGFRSWGVNAQFGQGGDGSARGTATLDRASGLTTTSLTVTNLQWTWPLAVSASTVWLDDAGRVVGFTAPFGATAAPVLPAGWPGTTTTAAASQSAVVGPDPGAASRARSAQVVLTRDGTAELRRALEDAVRLGQLVGQLVSGLG